MEAPLIAKDLDDENKALKSLLDTFGSVFSLKEIACAFCKAKRDANLAAEILRGKRTRKRSADATNRSKRLVNSEAASKATVRNVTASKMKRNPASVCNISGVRHIAGSNKNLNDTKLKKFETSPVASDASACKKNCVWRIAGSNGAPNEANPLKVKANGFPVPVTLSDKSLLSRNANSGSSKRPSSASNVSSNDDIENFLYGMLGHGFQLERSTIRKSLETLLDLTAVTLDRRNNLCEGNNLHTNSESSSYVKQGQKQKSCEIAADFMVKTTNPQFVNMKDDAEEGSYNALRKAVKEHRETMKAYYKAAAEALARGDRGQAVLLLEKGQFFYNKAREADEESSTKIFETSVSNTDGKMQEEISLDLQNHDAKEAIRLVKIHLRTLSGIPLVTDLKLIIGHGDRNVEKCKRMILKLLEKEDIKWIEDESSGVILIRLDEINPESLSFGRK
ncbi:putative nuclear RNA export factor SDE5 [Bienertia sinuspersici]